MAEKIPPNNIVAAVATLDDRYFWEVDAISEDIVNKVHMGILTSRKAISAYLADLLKMHPRVKTPRMALVTLISSKQDLSAGPRYLDCQGAPEFSQYCIDAYVAMTMDVEEKLLGTSVAKLFDSEE